MKSIGEILGSPLKPMLLLLLVLIAVAMLSGDPSSGQAAGGIACTGLTDNAQFNRMLCQLNPARLLDMPVTELFSGFLRG